MNVFSLIVVSAIFNACTLLAKESENVVSFVLEPFDMVQPEWLPEFTAQTIQSNLTATRHPDVTDLGRQVLQVNFTLGEDEGQPNTGSIGFGTMLGERRSFICEGANILFLRYMVTDAPSLPFTLRLFLYDGSECASGLDCNDIDDLEVYYSEVAVNSLLDIESPSWRTFSVSLNDTTTSWLQSTTQGVLGNRKLNLHKLRGWRIELSLEEKENGTQPVTGTLLLDQLGCLGDGDLLGAAFTLSGTFQDAIATGDWFERYYESPLSESLSEARLLDSELLLNYTIEQRESWGGFIDYGHISPGRAYYNISDGMAISLMYRVLQPATIANRALLRLIIMETSHCFNNSCDLHPGENLENFYSFHAVLDGNETTQGSVTVPLLGNEGSSSPFQHTGWFGTAGDKSLDPSRIKGFRLELNVGRLGDIGSLISGSIALRNLTALPRSYEIFSQLCFAEHELAFKISGSSFEFLEFRAKDCCDVCEKDPNCLFSGVEEQNCYKISQLVPGDLKLAESEFEIDHVALSSTNSLAKRGDYCVLCACRNEDQTIDCRGRDLALAPIRFTPSDGKMVPRVLDLRENPRLLVLGWDALLAIANELEEIRLPLNITYLSSQAIHRLTHLKRVLFEDNDVASVTTEHGHHLQNVISEPSGFFGNVCCGKDSRVDLLNPVEGLTFCEMQTDVAGIDAEYEEFITYFEAERLFILEPSSSFMSEASESPEKCAEYCAVQDECKYFSFDARMTQAEHSCHLLGDQGTPVRVCCNAEDYADDAETTPGWISGRVARTRHKVDNARVLLQDIGGPATPENGYTVTYSVSLGAQPKRGAVWIEPYGRAVNVDVEFEITPRRIALYDNETSATFILIVKKSEWLQRPLTILISNAVQSCDTAFLESQSEELQVYIDVLPPSPLSGPINVTRDSLIAFVTAGTVLIIVIVSIYRRKRQADSLWLAKRSEVHFDDPPQIIGDGTFGLVLLAEYRGTKVAVKRIQMTASMEDSFIYPHKKKKARPQSSTWYSSCTQRYRASTFTFIREVRHLVKLRHTCILSIMGAVVSDTSDPLILSEYMENGTLYELLRNETVALDGESILPILRDVVQGIRFLHSAKPPVLHCDIKSKNIFIDAKLRAKVADIVVNKRRARGKSYWMAPELLRGETPFTVESDAYSFGMTMYEVYARGDPYDGETDSKSVLSSIADPKVNQRPSMPDSCPPQMRELMLDCLESNPKDRPSFKDLDSKLTSFDSEAVEPGWLRSIRFRNTGRDILSEIFPKHVAEALRKGKRVEPESHDMVTIFFSDIVGFTTIASQLEPIKIANLLDRLYLSFDELSRTHDVFKVETIGDAWMGVTNLVKDQSSDHVKRIAAFASDAIKAAAETTIDEEDPELGSVTIRVGFHSGPVVADVVGSRSPRYCLFGDTVNTASRLESTGAAGRIQCSQASANLLWQQDQHIRITSRGRLEVKGKGKMHTYWVNDDQSTSIDQANLHVDEHGIPIITESSLSEDSLLRKSLAEA